LLESTLTRRHMLVKMYLYIHVGHMLIFCLECLSRITLHMLYVMLPVLDLMLLTVMRTGIQNLVIM